VETTANVLTAFNRLRGELPLDAPISGGIAWLLQKQNPDGGFGNSPSTVYDTARAVQALQEIQGSSEPVARGLNYILGSQSEDGSWYQSAYQTALAVDTVWKAMIDPDLSIKRDDISFIPATVTTLPTDIAIHAKIWNLGKTGVAQAKVVLYEGSISDATKIGEQVAAFPGESPVDLTFSATLRDGNEHRWHVVVDPDRLVRESSKTNNSAFNAIQPAVSYDFEVSPADIAISPSPVAITKDVRISAKVANRGTMNAYNVLIRCFIDDAGGPIDIAQATVDIPANTVITKELTWRANRAGANMPVAIWVDPVNAFTEISETNNKASVPLTVNGSTDPNLAVSYGDILITPAIAREGGNVTIAAVVRNDGFATASNIRVNFYEGAPGTDGALIESRTVSSLGAGQSQPVSVDWIGITESGQRVITVKVDPDGLIGETNEEDNQAFVTLQILSLPDLAISPASIAFSPSAPKEGDPVTIFVTVKNLGEQEASHALVRILEGETVIGNQMIATVPGNAQGVAEVTYGRPTKGAHSLRVVIDPDNTVVERNKDNNVASASFGMQDANLWATERYISPNGDEAKGSMQFFFRLNASQSVKVIVVDERGETVRTFSHEALNDTLGGNVTWDGLDERGMAVPDGQYQLKVMGSDGAVLGTLLVTVDNNRSSLLRAIGSKYLLTNNLTCMLPDFGRWSWFPDESGLLLNIYDPNPNTPDFPTGLYTLSPDGADAVRILPWEWSNTNPDYNYMIGYGNGYAVSPNGEKVAVSILKRHKQIWNDGRSQLWVVDRDGKNLKLLDEFNLSQTWRTIGDNVKWSLDGGFITYTVNNPEELWIVRPNGSGKTRIDGNYRGLDFNDLHWSPGETELAYVVEINDAYQLRVSDTAGNARSVMDGYITATGWLNGQRLIVLSEAEGPAKGLWLLDASGTVDPVLVTENTIEGSGDSGEKFFIAADGSSFAYIERNANGSSVMIADGSGQSEPLHEVLPAEGTVLVDLRWSPDGTKLAFVDRGYERINECLTKAHLVIVDPKTREKQIFMISNQDNLCGETFGSVSAMAQTTRYRPGSLQWFSDNRSFIAVDSRGAFAISTPDGEKAYLPVQNPQGLTLSPLGRYLTYKQYVDYSSVCYGKGYQDLWALSSLLNLTAELRATKEHSAVLLKGIAADLNFEGYRLEYADVTNPDLWNLVEPPSSIPVIDDLFATWVPPYEGTFHVKLTVWDRAGNVKSDRKRVSWDLPVKITNVYKTADIFAPSGSGANATAELHYRAVQPVHLEFNIYNARGEIVRTYLKDHASPAEDAMSWDGRDKDGRIVPDGRYKLQVLGYEFYVEIDNTPPEVDVALGAIRQRSTTDGRPTGSMVAGLDGYAFDTGIKNWVIEYGEGDNPSEWNEYARGDDLLVVLDEAGNPERSPDGTLKSVSIATIEDVEWLIGKKFRISAEDFAGNRASVIAGYLEEKIFLKGWNGEPLEVVFSDRIDALPMVPANLIRPGLHSLDVLESIRMALAGVQVQYWTNRQWVNGPMAGTPLGGQIYLPWDNSAINPDEILVVRVKAVDELGIAHESNMLSVKSLFRVTANCQGEITGHNNLFETLKLLEVQIKSDKDPDYPQWTDYASYSTEAEASVPEGRIELPVPPIREGMNYTIRMVGTGAGADGVVYSTDEIPFPQTCPGITLNVQYPEAPCNTPSGKALLQTEMEIDRASTKLISLDYHLEKTEGAELLRHFDLSTDKLEKVTIDTSVMAEGRYPVKATLKYLDLRNNTEAEASDTKTVDVDVTPPVARITFPGPSQLLCPVTMTGPKGDWYGVPVEAVASDDAGIRRCKTGSCGIQLYYGTGKDPVGWIAAKTQQEGSESPIIGDKAVQGRLALWDVTNLGQTDYTLQLKVVDASGNASCHQAPVAFDHLVEIADLTRNTHLISPNADGILDNVRIDYRIDEYATVSVLAANLITQPDGTYGLDEMPIRTIVDSTAHTGGTGYTLWDGRNEYGAVVPDGVYGIVVFARDGCGNVNLKWVAVEVDNTPPTTVILYPRPPDALGNIVEIKATSEDIHFLNYTLEAGQGNSPTQWITLLSGMNPAKDDILGQWNTFGLEGIWTIRLTSTDATGNRSLTSVTVNLDQRKTLIKEFTITPLIFSPNGDGKSDAAGLRYEVTDAVQATLEIRDAEGLIRRTLSEMLPSAGTYVFAWDGNDDGGSLVPDGQYEVSLTAALSSNPSVTQTESVALTVDATPPNIALEQPQNDSFFRSDVPVVGTIYDDNLVAYSSTYAGGTFGPTILDQGNQSRDSYHFGIMSDLPEEKIDLLITATDGGDNVAEMRVSLTVDRTPPVVDLERPGKDEYYGNGKSRVDVAGRIVETNLDRYGLRYGLGSNPSEWVELLGGDTPPAEPDLFSWKVGKDDGITDGIYTVSLYARDKAGQASEQSVRLIVDNTSPEVSLSTPVGGAYIRTADPIKGTASDANIEKYSLEIAEGPCGNAFRWATFETSLSSVTDGMLATWPAVPSDGDYCLRLTAVDKLGNMAEATTAVRVDMTPPPSPVLSGRIVNRTNAELAWPGIPQPDTAGYHIYRGTQMIATLALQNTGYADLNLPDGLYSYAVTAIDLAGNESGPSNRLSLRVDTKPPEAKIRSPQDGGSMGGLIDIKGTAYSVDDFKEYRIYVGQGADPSQWTLLRTSSLPLPYDSLIQWDAAAAEGLYSVKLEAEDINGNIASHRIIVMIDNLPPAAPVLLSATPNAASVAITWSANTEADLAGYLLFSNDRLANAPGIAVGNLKPYLVTGTSQPLQTLPDGRYKFYLMAMDHAGNLSGSSNVLEVTIDTGAPHATITDPAGGMTFQDKILVRAESPDSDIATVQFQYKKAQDSNWLSLGSAADGPPYLSFIDPISLGINYGDYDIRAVATDRGGAEDPSPSSITITYADMTAPGIPAELKTSTHGTDVILNWQANAETDLDGYNIYRTKSGTATRVNTAIVKDTTYQDTGLADGDYAYTVTAVDSYANESVPSAAANAKVYAPELAPPDTPSEQKVVAVTGGNAGANASVEIFLDTGLGPVSLGTIPSGIDGNFTTPTLNLVLGENRITARATDVVGNISRTSAPAFIVYNEPPAAPTGLAAAVMLPDVVLTWSPNADSDLAGYNIYRNGSKINAPLFAAAATATAASCQGNYPPGLAIDDDPFTYWSSPFGFGQFNAVWWQLALPSPELISRVAILWGVKDEGLPGEKVYAGKDFQIQAWSGYSWIPLATVSGNALKNNTIDLTSSYRTDRIRILITETTDPDASRQVWIAEAAVWCDNLITEIHYEDFELYDGRYRYKLTAVDYYGLESAPAGEVEAIIGDVVAPSAPMTLTATPAGSDIVLNWTENPEPDVVGYNLYRMRGPDWIRVNALLIRANGCTDTGLVNGDYAYRITAVDESGNESPPSAETAATVSVALPPAPTDVAVFALPEGGALTISWQYTGPAVVGFNIYRSIVSGGVYTRINSGLIGETSFADRTVANGIRYFYVIVAVDASGNESARANDINAIPSDTLPPASPSIAYPTLPGFPVILYSDKTDVTGSAEPGSLVELFRGGVPLGQSTASEEERTQTLSTGDDGYLYYLSLSPNGKMMMYTRDDQTIWIRHIDTDKAVRIAENGDNGSWSSDMSTIVYAYWDGDGSYRLGIHDVKTGASVPLTEDRYVYEASPSLSSDGTIIAFISTREGNEDVWLKDLTDGSFLKLTSGAWVSSVRLSPDARMAAYAQGSVLNIIDLGTSSVFPIDMNSDGYSLAWSPEGRRLAFVSSLNGNPDVFIYDTDTRVTTRITHSADMKLMPAWSPDGKSLAFVNRGDFGDSIITAPASGQGPETKVVQRVIDLGKLMWARSGALSFNTGNILNVIHFRGIFIVTDVTLQPGENIVHATASDASGNTSDPSAGIAILLDDRLVPDLAVAAADVFIYPPCPRAGDPVAIHVTVHNLGQVDVEGVKLNIAMDSTDRYEFLKSVTIERIAASSTKTIAIDWDSTGRPGRHTVSAVLDPENGIAERSEANNAAVRELAVTANYGLAMATRLDANRYLAHQNVDIVIAMENSDEDRDATLAVAIEDETGIPAATLEPLHVSIPYASSRDFNFHWNTGSTFSGRYSAHSTARSSSGAVLAESRAPFEILPDSGIDGSIHTDRAEYGSYQDVALRAAISNIGANRIIPELFVGIRLYDPSGATVFAEERRLSAILPGAANVLGFRWNTAASASGTYTALLEILSADHTVLLTKTAMFVIGPLAVVQGTVAVSPQVVVYGDTYRVNCSIRNNGNSDLGGLLLNLLIIDPATQAVMAIVEKALDLEAGDSQSLEEHFVTKGYALKTYTVALQSTHGGITTRIAAASLSVGDGTPPALTVLSPAPGKIFNSTVHLTVAASDDISAIARVEYRVDDGDWQPLSPSSPSAGRYSGSWLPGQADDGFHVIGFRATDGAGNTGQTASVTFTTDITPPDPPVIVTPPHDTVVPAEVVAIKGTTEPGARIRMIFSGLASAQADAATGTFDFAGVKLLPGANILKFTATDPAGNMSQPTDHVLNVVIPPSLDVSIALDKAEYHADQDVVITSTLRNTSSDSPLNGLTARVSIIGSQEQVISSEDKTLASLPAGQSATLMTPWNTARNPKGPYRARIEVFGASGKNEATSGFAILGTSETGDGLKGTITAAPNPVYRGVDETISYSVTNDGNEDVANLAMTVTVVENATQTVKKEFSRQKTLPKGETTMEGFTVATAALTPGGYTAVLTLAASSLPAPKLLAGAAFEVMPGVEITHGVADVTNVLVWAEKRQRSSRHGKGQNIGTCGDRDRRCVRIDLLEEILRTSVTNYRMVTDRNDFQREVRNPYFTDYFIVGDYESLEDSYGRELREQIYEGKGMVSSLYLNFPEESNSREGHLMGVRFEGALEGDRHDVELLRSPLSAPGELTAEGRAVKVEAERDAGVAAWLNGPCHGQQNGCGCGGKYPAIVLGGYGEGKTVFYAFDLVENLVEETFEEMKTLIVSSIKHAHRESHPDFYYPSRFVPLATTLKGRAAAFDIRLMETCSADLKLYDPLTGQWAPDNPWITDIHLEPNQTRTVFGYAFTPDRAGSYALQTEAGYVQNGQCSFEDHQFSTDITVSKNRRAAAADIITALNRFAAPWHDRAKMREVARYIGNVRDRPGVTLSEMEKNIRDLLKATEKLYEVRSCDVKPIRLMIGRLLQSWEGGWYFAR
jgi:subtilase family serine protease/Tol biopolymer transport system component/flagellar hook assembly protein FlgD/fibronectin type 3 domain-containing protein